MSRTAGMLVQTIKDATVVTLEDNCLIDGRQIERLGEELNDLVQTKDRRKLVLDMAKVRHFSSSVLSVLLVLRNNVEKAKGELVLCSASKEILKLFKMAALHKLFTFADNEKKALKKLGVDMN